MCREILKPRKRALTLTLLLDNALCAIPLAAVFNINIGFYCAFSSILQGQCCLITYLNDLHWGTYSDIDWGWILHSPHPKAMSRSSQHKSWNKCIFHRFHPLYWSRQVSIMTAVDTVLVKYHFNTHLVGFECSDMLRGVIPLLLCPLLHPMLQPSTLHQNGQTAAV